LKIWCNKGALALGILTILVSVVGLTGCASPVFASPPPLTFKLPPPKAATVDQLYKDYMTDPAAADAKYAGQRFYFAQVKAEAVSKELYPLRSPDPHLWVGPVQFKPRYGSDLWPVWDDTLVDIVGEVQGLMLGYIVVKDCWIRIVSGGGDRTVGY
jgi:hypothetical protein